MKTRNLLFIGILVGLVLSGFFEFSGFDPTYGRIISAAIIGIVIGKKMGKGSEKYAFLSIFTYNLIGLILIFLFTADGKLALQYEGIALFALIGTALIIVFFYSIFGSFVAFVSSNLGKNKQHEGL